MLLGDQILTVSVTVPSPVLRVGEINSVVVSSPSYIVTTVAKRKRGRAKRKTTGVVTIMTVPGVVPTGGTVRVVGSVPASAVLVVVMYIGSGLRTITVPGSPARPGNSVIVDTVLPVYVCV